MENAEIVERKKLLDLAMDFYFLNGVTSESNVESAEIAVRAGYDMYFGEGASRGMSEQDLIRNALDCYEYVSTLIMSVGKRDAVAEFTVDELIINHKRVLNVAKEISFISGAKRSDYKQVGLCDEYLRKDFESIFGKGSSKGKTYSKMAGDTLAYLESKTYPKANDFAISEKA